VDFIASALGADAGPDERVRLEGTVARGRDGLTAGLCGPAPAAFGLPGARLRLRAAFVR
jgi:hypothetical protein